MKSRRASDLREFGSRWPSSAGLEQMLFTCERRSMEINATLRVVAMLLSHARRRLEEAIGDAHPDPDGAIEEASGEVEPLIDCARTLALQAQAAQRQLREQVDVETLVARQARSMSSQGDLCELDNALDEFRARLGHSEKTLQRLLGCAGEIIDDLYAAMKAYQPTVQQLAAVDALFARLRAPRH